MTVSGWCGWAVIMSAGPYTHRLGSEAGSFMHATSPPPAKPTMSATFHLPLCSLDGGRKEIEEDSGISGASVQ